MDYTTIALVKSEIHSQLAVSTDDALLATLITSASRSWDRHCTNTPLAKDYFKREDVVGEKLEGLANYDGTKIVCYPHKPVVNSIASFSFQENIVSTSYTVDPSRVDINGMKVVAYPSGMPIRYPGKCKVTISYNGGLGETVADLPEDMVEAVTLLAIRFYREAESGLSDQMGISEMGSFQYTKAWPVRVKEILNYYRRRAGWDHAA
jgi:hypothetical protein